MRNLQAPVRDDVADYRSIVAGTRDLERAAYLDGLFDRIVDAYCAYAGGVRGQIHVQPMSVSSCEREVLLWAYNTLHHRVIGKSMREDLRSAVQDLLCPICAIDRVSTLDHFAPKSVFPEYALFSQNLVPMCATCNNLRSADPAEELGLVDFFHVYLEILPEVPILTTTVGVEQRSWFARFGLLRAPNQSVDNFAKIENLVERISLRQRIEEVTPGELAVLKEMYSQPKELLCIENVRYCLRREATVYAQRYGPNFWRTVLLRGVCELGDGELRTVLTLPG